MSLIKDVKIELKQLDVSGKALRKNGFVLASVFTLIALLPVVFEKLDYMQILSLPLFILSAYLFVVGAIKPTRLELFYVLWMIFAFAMGWVVSKVIMFVLFYGFVTSISAIAKLFNAKFVDLRFKSGATTYWIEKKKKIIDYEKMF